VVIAKKYDRKFLYLVFLKCYYHLHPMTKIEGGFAMSTIIEDCNLDFFFNKLSTQMSK
jgi:hypothetical protein